MEVRPELWLDLYLALSGSDQSEPKQVAATYAAGNPGRIHALSLVGGDPMEGEKVFRNQGRACNVTRWGAKADYRVPNFPWSAIGLLRPSCSSPLLIQVLRSLRVTGFPILPC